MSEHVLHRNDLCNGDVFQIRHQARTALAIKDIDLASFFGANIDRFEVGDRVEICVYADRTWNRLLEMRECRVTEQTGPRGSSGRKVGFEWIGEAMTFGQGERIASTAGTDVKPKFKVEAEFGAGFNVVDEKGNVVEKLKTKPEADAYAKSLNGGKPAPSKQPEAPKMKPKPKEPEAPPPTA